MSALIISLADARAARAGGSPVATDGQNLSGTAVDTAARFYFWTGASGRRYVHTIYSVFDCPPLEAANYILAKRNGSAHRTVLAVGRFASEASPENLKALRQKAGELGADEVHVHLLATSASEAQAITNDLMGGMALACSN
jgi:hypothetical protein